MTFPDWVNPLASGVSFGLLLAVLLGPVFFALIQTSLHEGFKAGVHLAFGVLLSDITLILICYFFASLITLIDSHHLFMSIVGGILFIGFGIYTFFHRIKLKEVNDAKKIVHAQFIAKGFLLNILNPAVLLFWLGVVGLVNGNPDYTTLHESIFIFATLVTVFSTDILKSFVAHRIKSLLKPVVMLWLNRIIGLALIGFGVNIFIRLI